MAIVSRAILKQYFEQQDMPTEGQFVNLIESLFNLNDDKVEYSNLSDELRDYFTLQQNISNKQRYWIVGSTDTVEPADCKVVSGDYILDDATLLIKSSTDTTNVAGINFLKKGTMQIAGHLFIKDGTLTNNGTLVIGGYLIHAFNATITGLAGITMMQSSADEVPLPESGFFVGFIDENGTKKRKDYQGNITNL
jgi:hypothetical protein